MKFNAVASALVLIIFAASTLAVTVYITENRESSYHESPYLWTRNVFPSQLFIIERSDGSFDIYWNERIWSSNEYEVMRNESLGGIRHLSVDRQAHILSNDTKLLGRSPNTSSIISFYIVNLTHDRRLARFAGDREYYMFCNGSQILTTGEWKNISFLASLPVADYEGKWLSLSFNAVVGSDGNLTIFDTDFYMKERHTIKYTRYVPGRNYQGEDKLADDIYLYAAPAATPGDNGTIYLAYQNLQGHIVGGMLNGTKFQSGIVLRKPVIPGNPSHLLLKFSNSTLHMLEIDENGYLWYRQFDSEWRLILERNLTAAVSANFAITDSGAAIVFTAPAGGLNFMTVNMHGEIITSPHTLVSKRYVESMYLF